uniref:Uncharacterized protein n=1 Tax=Ackermannviridae sp. TaxID=2831612 RepID=A0A8S5RTX4_9CAUD|nr:MAG TPA: hypothetical protein [Ackermannviridae sp.]
MKIYDETLTTELESPDLTLGRLESARRLVAHHNAVERQYHYEVMEGTVTDERPEGLRREVEDVAAAAAWDEYEDVQKYVPYTEAELAEQAAKKQAEEAEKAKREAAMKKAAEEAQARAEADAAAKAEQEAKIAKIDAIEAQTTYTAMMTDTLMEEAR